MKTTFEEIEDHCKWFECISLRHLSGLIRFDLTVHTVVLRRTVVGDISLRFDNLSGSHKNY